MIVLQSIDKYDDLAIIDEKTSGVDFVARQIYTKDRAVSIGGAFSYVDGHFVAIYRINNNLQLRIDSKSFNLDSTMRAEISRGHLNIFRLINRLDQSLVVEMAYNMPQIYPPLEIDLTPFVEEEDFDLFLLTHNIVNNIERMKRAFR